MWDLLPHPIEWVRPVASDPDFQAVLFDFDGTLSYLRSGWPEIMTAMMFDELRPIAEESDVLLRQRIEDFIFALNGRPAIFQMRQLVAEIVQRGWHPQQETDYLHEYDRRLNAVVRKRIEAIETGQEPRSAWALPGVEDMLQRLRDRGLKLYLASGTLRPFVMEEAELLGLARYFPEEIHAPDGLDSNFSKRNVIERILDRQSISGENLLGFGDGVVENAEVARVGGTAIAVASREDRQPGIDTGKRQRLIEAGAQGVIADFRRRV